MAKVKFKVGDKAEITQNTSSHQYPDGRIVKITDISSNYCYAEGLDNYNDKNGRWYVKHVDMKLVKPQIKIKSMKKANVTSMTVAERKAAVLKVAQDLCVPNNTVTTLELKLELRNRWPNIEWNKYYSGSIPGVSDLFHELVQEGRFKSVDDNGTFQTYADTSRPTPTKEALKKVPVYTKQTKTVYTALSTASTPTSIAAPKPKKDSTADKAIVSAPVQRISRKKALQLMQDNKGRFFTVVFKKKDGTTRTMNAQYMKDQDQSVLGYVKVREASKLKTDPADSVRQINLQTLSQVKIGGSLYKIS